MAKADYFVIMYLFFKPFFALLQEGETISNDEIDSFGLAYNQTYWEYILINLAHEGYIEGVFEAKILSGRNVGYRDGKITHNSIEYWFSHSMME